MARYNNGLSMEDLYDETDAAIVEDTTAEPEEAPELPDAEEVQSGSDVDVVEDAIDQVNDVAEGLEEIKEAMLVALGNGGMTAGEAAFARLAVKNACGRWVKPLAIPSTENFEESRITATTYALEEVRTGIKGIWDKIVAFIGRWWNAFKQVWKKYIYGAGKLASNAKKLADRAQNIKGNPAKKISLDSNLEALMSKGTTFTAEEVASNLFDLVTLIKALESKVASGSVIQQAIMIIKGLDLSTVESAERTASTLFNSSTYTVEGMATKLKGECPLFKEKVQNTTPTTPTWILKSGSFIGGMQVIAQLEGTLGDGIFTKLEMKAINTNKPSKGSKERASWNNKQCIAVLNAIEAVGNGIQSANKEVEQRQALGKELERVLDEKSKQLAKSGLDVEKTKAGKYLNACIHGYSSTAKATIEPDSIVQKHALNVARTAYGFAKQCLGGYSEKN